jgi:hypothetical protein
VAPHGFSAHRIRTPDKKTIGFDDLAVFRQVDRPQRDPAGARRVRAEHPAKTSARSYRDLVP